MARVAEENKHEQELQQGLVARIKGGEREAFNELVGQYQKKIFVFAYGFFPNREDALEIVQETFMRVIVYSLLNHRQLFSKWHRCSGAPLIGNVVMWHQFN